MSANLVRNSSPKRRLGDGLPGIHDFFAEMLNQLIVLAPYFQIRRAAVQDLFQRNDTGQDLLLLSFSKRRIADRQVQDHPENAGERRLSYA